MEGEEKKGREDGKERERGSLALPPRCVILDFKFKMCQHAFDSLARARSAWELTALGGR